jgi:hypothetical protein
MCDEFCRIGDVDYLVPPGLVGRRVQVPSSPTDVMVSLEGHEYP